MDAHDRCAIGHRPGGVGPSAGRGVGRGRCTESGADGSGADGPVGSDADSSGNAVGDSCMPGASKCNDGNSRA
jgi:hypothetical protein